MTISELVDQLKTDYPDITFVPSGDFKWSPDNKSISFNPGQPSSQLLLLHEIAHLELKHANYRFDIELLKKEVDAWEYAKNTLCPRYQVVFDEDLAQSTIDTYREWLHARSRCPNCQATGAQFDTNGSYHCVDCQHFWRVNDAKFTELRRFTKLK